MPTQNTNSSHQIWDDHNLLNPTSPQQQEDFNRKKSFLDRVAHRYKRVPVMQTSELPLRTSPDKWVRNAAERSDKQGYEITQSGPGEPYCLYYKKECITSLDGFTYLYAQDTGESLVHTPRASFRLPYELGIRKRPQKRDIMFTIRFSDGTNITSDDNVDVMVFLLLSDGEKPYALFASINGGGQQGYGGICLTLDSELIRTCMSFCQTLNNFASVQQKLLMAENAERQESFLDSLDDDDDDWFDSDEDIEWIDSDKEVEDDE